MAISIDLLDLYSALFDRSADAVTALAAALKTMYSRRGFPVLNSKVCLVVSDAMYQYRLVNIPHRASQFGTLSVGVWDKPSSGMTLSGVVQMKWWRTPSINAFRS